MTQSCFQLVRKLVFISFYLKDALKDLNKPSGAKRAGKGGGLTDAALATLVNEVMTHEPDRFTIEEGDIQELMSAANLKRPFSWYDTLGRAFERLQEQQKDAGRLSRVVRIDQHLPVSLEENYAEKVPEIFRQAEFSLRGEEKRDVLDKVLPGAWYFYYVRPVNEKGKPKKEIRKLIAVFGKSRADGTWSTFLLVSKKAGTHYRGIALAREHYLYMTGTDYGKNNEVVFFIVSEPSRRSNFMFAGIGAALINPPDTNLPVAGIVCFGERIAHIEDGALVCDKRENRDGKWEPVARISDEQKNVIEAVMKTGHIPPGQLAVLESVVQEVVFTDHERFKKMHPLVYDYMMRLKIDGEKGFPKKSLHIVWP